MSQQFDPYRKWLGIPPKDQPPHHYRLLGIPVFEDDPDVIENAADRQMAHVRTYQTSQHAAASQKILNELAAAKLCLLTPAEKSAYDDVLRAGLRTDPAAPPAAPPTPPPGLQAEASLPPEPGLPEPVIGGPAKRPAPRQPVDPGSLAVTAVSAPISTVASGATASRARPRRKSSPLPLLLIGGGAAVLLIALLGIGLALSGSGPDDANVASPATAEEDTPFTRFDPPDTSLEPGRDRGGRTGVGRPARPPRRDQPPRTDFGLHVPQPGDGNSGTTELNPNDFGLPTRAEQVQQALADVRQALRTRDLTAARRHLEDADRAKADPVESARVEDARVLLMYCDGFGRRVQRGASSIKPDTEFELGDRTVTMVQVKGDTITYNDGTSEQEIRLTDLSPEDALALADRVTESDDALAKLQRAAFLAVDGQGDHDANVAEAKRLWQAAAAEGIQNTALARELGIFDEVAVQPLPGDDQPSFEPPPLPGLEPGEEVADTPPDDQPTASQPKRKPIPEAADLRTARTRVLNNYRQQFAQARLPAQKSELAKQIYEAALSEQDDAYRYALLEKARDVAVDLAVPEALVGIVDEMADQFELDAPKEKATYLGEAIMAANSDAQNAQIFDHARKLYEQAVREGNYEAAAQLAEAATRAARKAKKAAALKTAEDDLTRAQQILDAKQKAEAARETLKTDADDSAANEALGRYLCFYDDDWRGGLPLLAKAADEQLKKLAASEMERPRAAAEQTALADAWLALGQDTPGRAGDAMRRRALGRYRHIGPFLEGDEKTRVAQKVSELAAELDPKPAPAEKTDEDADDDPKAGKRGRRPADPQADPQDDPQAGNP